MGGEGGIAVGGTRNHRDFFKTARVLPCEDCGTRVPVAGQDVAPKIVEIARTGRMGDGKIFVLSAEPY